MALPLTTDAIGLELAYEDPSLARAGALNQHILQLTRTMQTIKSSVAAHRNDGVSWSTYVLLFHLTTLGPLRTKELAESACVDPSTISRQVDQLVKLGHVERRADPDDGRATVLAPTEQGRETHCRMRTARDQMMAAVLAGWDPTDVDDLTSLLGRLTGDLSDALPRILQALTEGHPVTQSADPAPATAAPKDPS